MIDPCNILYHNNDQELAMDFLISNDFFSRRIAMLLGTTCITKKLLYSIFKTRVIDLANYIIVEQECSSKYINNICNYLKFKGYNFYTCSIVPSNFVPSNFFQIPLYIRQPDFYRLQNNLTEYKSISNPLNLMIHTNIVIELPKDKSIYDKINTKYQKYITKSPHRNNINMIVEEISLLPHNDFGIILQLRDTVFKYL